MVEYFMDICHFLYRVHPAPHDYIRYTDQAISTLLKSSGFEDFKIKVHFGVFKVIFDLIHGFLKVSAFSWLRSILALLALYGDYLISKIKQLNAYALGYFFEAKKRC
jgi:hypothetical protein